MNPSFQEGVIRVQLSQLISDDLDPYGMRRETDLTQLLQDPRCTIEGRITSRTREKILGTLKWSASQLLHSQEAPFVPSATVYCSATSNVIRTAIHIHGDNYVCRVRLHCIPPKPHALSDGDVYRNMRHYMTESRYTIADSWLNRLSACKKKILQLVMRRKPIVDAMDGMLPFLGLWGGLEIGNWAKHLAAHDDDLIINYWNHMKSQWSHIMAGLEDSRHLIDLSSVRRIARRVPALSICDKDQVIKDFANKKNPLFPGITKQQDRNRLEENIISIAVMIPSIDTFHDNMRYLTIGAKILEKHIQSKPKRVSTVSGSRLSLFESLKVDWTDTSRVQTNHREFKNLQRPTTARFAYMQLLVAALRYFPFLSLEPPLQDIEGIGAQVDRHYLELLCMTARSLGFINAKVEKGCEVVGENAPRNFSEPDESVLWRGGKPSYQAMKQLHQQSFLPQLLHFECPSAFENCQDVPVLYVQRDILMAFFGRWPDKNITDILSKAGQKRSRPLEQDVVQKRRQTVWPRRLSDSPSAFRNFQTEDASRKRTFRLQKGTLSRKAGHKERFSRPAGIKAVFLRKKEKKKREQIQKSRSIAQNQAVMSTDEIFHVPTTDTFAKTEIGMEMELDPEIPDIAHRLSVPEFSDLFLQSNAPAKVTNEPDLSINPRKFLPGLGLQQTGLGWQPRKLTGQKEVTRRHSRNPNFTPSPSASIQPGALTQNNAPHSEGDKPSGYSITSETYNMEIPLKNPLRKNLASEPSTNKGKTKQSTNTRGSTDMSLLQVQGRKQSLENSLKGPQKAQATQQPVVQSNSQPTRRIPLSESSFDVFPGSTRDLASKSINSPRDQQDNPSGDDVLMSDFYENLQVPDVTDNDILSSPEWVPASPEWSGHFPEIHDISDIE